MRQALYVERTTKTQEFVVADLGAAERFWDPLMAYLGWNREDQDGLCYGNGEATVVFHAGQPWDSVINEANRTSPFAHLAFELDTLGELDSLACSIEFHQEMAVDIPDEFLTDRGWRRAMVVTDPNGLQVEITSPA